MPNSKNVKILTDPGEWIPGFNAFVPKGKVVAVDSHVVKNKLKKLTGRFEILGDDAKVDFDAAVPVAPTAKQVAAAEAASVDAAGSESSEIWSLEFPSRELLTRGGILTVDGLNEFVATNGDAWFQQVEGLDAAKAKAVTDHVAKLKKKKK